MHWYPRYVPVDEQRARAVSEMHELRARGLKVQPIELRGRTIARRFWGRHWCEHLESFSEYAARLAHGRAYVRNGSVCHLAIEAGGVDARVVGSALYRVRIRVRQLHESVWMAIRKACAGRLGSLQELHEGRLSDPVVEAVTHRGAGLFPQPNEILPSCECADRTPMCKHAAAVLSGVGSRLDDRPELLFVLRGVDATELIASDMPPASDTAAADVSGIEMRNGAEAPNATAPMTPNVAEPAGSSTATQGVQGSTDSLTPPRRVKKTLTYRPPTPTAALPLATPTDYSEAAGFQPTGALVAELRDQCGCSVTEFADLIQVTPTTVRRWETTPGPLSLHARPWEALLALHREIERHSG